MRGLARFSPYAAPFAITLGGLGAPYLLLMLNGFCRDDPSCAAASYLAGPFLLLLAIVTGFVVGRLSSSKWLGLVGVAAAAFAPPLTLFLAVEVAGGVTDPQSVAAAFASEWGYAARAWLAFTTLASIVMLPGYLVGRERRAGSERKRQRQWVAGEVASLAAMRDAGTMDPLEFQSQKAALLGSLQAPDQAPPNHRCGRCGKPLSPAWRGRCKHCGARYLDFPPVSNDGESDAARGPAT